MNEIISAVRKGLLASISESNCTNSQRYFKEEINAHGLKVPVVNRLAKELFKQVKLLNKQEIFALCDILWESGNLEESFIACNWLNAISKQFSPEDFNQFKKWIEHDINNWASCDTFCNHSVGDFIQMYPEFLDELKKLARSPNKWARRAAAVSLIIPAKKGMFLETVFEIADILLVDKEDLVQKGYGWMLKVTSQAHQIEVFHYVINNKSVMPRTALRYAIEKMPKELRAEAMKK
ncbi:DNA alkylation repair protein [Puteibacter caeruleilacunae]|nr:DNA alkylation repair protein [Puteibacter caeruleilacunae]